MTTAHSISNLMTADHRKCDLALEEFESFISKNEFKEALDSFKKWRELNLKHFSLEEETLFPETIKTIGMKIPPITVMEMEHMQIRNCFLEIENAIREESKDKVHHLAETCLIMIQQHNMKEEQILYPIIDRSLQQNQNEICLLINEKLMPI